MAAANDPVQILTITPGSAEVRLRCGGATMCIGNVGSSNGRWFWQHRDGERSSLVAANRSDATNALADYHQEFKRHHRSAMSSKRLLFS